MSTVRAGPKECRTAIVRLAHHCSDFKQFRAAASGYFRASGDARCPVRKSICSGSLLKATLKQLVAADTLAVARILDLHPSGLRLRAVGAVPMLRDNPF